MYYIYFIQSEKNNKVYVGCTSKHPDVRLKEHNQGSNKFTKSLIPWKLIYYESFQCEKCAKNREKFYKSGIGKKVKKLIVENFSSGYGLIG
ncbi:MAG: GIY-YIG nuclease family protein [bacterium]